MILAILAILAIVVCVGLLAAAITWVVRRLLDYRIGDATRALATHDIVCVTAGRRPTWAVRPRDGSDEQPIPDGKHGPSVSVWGQAVATLDEEAA